MSTRLAELTAADYKGPRAAFLEVHVLKAIFEISKLGSVGRGRLGTLLNLGQGEVRTLIKRLKDRGLIRIEASGCVLTQKGRREYSAISHSLPWVSLVDGRALGMGKYSYAVLIRGKTGKVKKGLEQRDASIKVGASGAITVVYSSGRFRFPDDRTDCEKSGKTEPWETLRSVARPRENDAFVISFASNSIFAEYGALSAALTLV